MLVRTGSIDKSCCSSRLAGQKIEFRAFDHLKGVPRCSLLDPRPAPIYLLNKTGVWRDDTCVEAIFAMLADDMDYQAPVTNLYRSLKGIHDIG